VPGRWPGLHLQVALSDFAGPPFIQRRQLLIQEDSQGYPAAISLVPGWIGGGESQVFLIQPVVVFRPVRVVDDALDRAYAKALGFAVMTDAFGAEIGIDHVDRLAFRDGAIRAFRLADIAVDAVVGYQ
jgi:hypothetical protein